MNYCDGDFSFDPRKHVLGVYLNELARNCTDTLDAICEEQKFGYSAYYRAIYAAYCNFEWYVVVFLAPVVNVGEEHDGDHFPLVQWVHFFFYKELK